MRNSISTSSKIIQHIFTGRRKKTSGFTLVELLVVVVIIAVLAAIAVPVFLNQKTKASEASLEASVATMASVITTAVSTGGTVNVLSTSVAVTDGSGATITVPVPANVSFRILIDPDGSGITYQPLKGTAIVANTPLSGSSTYMVSAVGPTSNNITMSNGSTKPDSAAANPAYTETPLNGTANNGGSGGSGGGGGPVNSGIIATIIGNHTFGCTFSNGSPATSITIANPYGIVGDSAGNTYVMLGGTCRRLVKLNVATGTATTYAGTGSAGSTGDGGPATAAKFSNPKSLAINSAGDIFIADQGNSVIRKVTASTGIITTVAGTMLTSGFQGDGGPATAARLSNPGAVAVDTAGNLYIADLSNYRIRKVDTSGNITTVAGNGLSGNPTGDGGLATAAALGVQPSAIAVDTAGNIYMAPSNGALRKITVSTGIITTIAGTNGVSSYTGDGGPATAATFMNSQGITVDAYSNIYVGDGLNCAIRKIDGGTGIITTIAGTGSPGYSGDGGQATSALLYQPRELYVDAAGKIYFSDASNSVVRRIG